MAYQLTAEHPAGLRSVPNHDEGQVSCHDRQGKNITSLQVLPPFKAPGITILYGASAQTVVSGATGLINLHDTSRHARSPIDPGQMEASCCGSMAQCAAAP